MSKHVIQLDKVYYHNEIYYSAMVKNYYIKAELVGILNEIGAEVIHWDMNIMFPETSLFHLEMHKPDIHFEVVPDA